MSEEVIYSDRRVSITTSRLVFGATTYALRNITSVKIGSTPDRGGAICLTILGAVSLFYGLANLFGHEGGMAFLACFVGVILAGIGVLWLRSCKDDCHILIVSSSGEVKALTSKDRAYIEKIVISINDAIIKCR